VSSLIPAARWTCSPGGKVSSTVDSGFVNVTGGKAVSTIVVSDGVEQVLAGIDSLTTISSGGFAFVNSGATAIGTKIEGFQRVEGKATGAKVSSGGGRYGNRHHGI